MCPSKQGHPYLGKCEMNPMPDRSNVIGPATTASLRGGRGLEDRGGDTDTTVFAAGECEDAGDRTK